MESPDKPSARKHTRRQKSLKIEISQYDSLFKLLNEPRSVFRMIFTLSLFMLLLFFGLGIVTIVIKQLYPYNDIRTNMLGATTMRDESTEVTYWLFNTAELWADSGIHVEEGDVLTIRASGKAHTAIHHLIDNVRNNEPLQDHWVGTAGDDRTDATAKARGKFRIFADLPQDALVMQVIPEQRNTPVYGPEFYLRPDDYITAIPLNREDSIRHLENFYFIGKERVDLHINHAGTLHFAVNDIPLTKPTIFKMLCRTYGLDWETQAHRFSDNNTKNLRQLTDSAAFRTWYEQISTRPDSKELGLHSYPTEDTIYSGKNELLYYYDTQYCNAWYDDNVGSFLVVIERKYKK